MGLDSLVIMFLHKYIYKAGLKSQTTTLSKFKWLDNLSKQNEEDVNRIQEERLFNLLKFSRFESDLYSDRIPSSILQSDTGRVSRTEISKIEPLSKEDLRLEHNRLLTKNPSDNKTYWNKSGGSTGEPVEFLQDKEYRDTARAVTFLFNQWSGYELGEKKVWLWGSERDLFTGSEKITTKIKRKIKNEIWLNSFKMGPEEMQQYVENINSFQPVQILGYAESTYELASFIENNDLDVYSPKAIMTSAGNLYPHMRDTIERVFDAPVYDRYGSREVGDIACECPKHEGLHISSPTHLVEVVDNDGNHVNVGEQGHVLVTSLTNYSMPLIRYQIGDMAVWGGYSCSCDLPFPVLKEISGRETSMFYTKSGDVISPEYFIHLLGVVLDPEWIEKFQIVQKEHDRVLIKCVSTMSFSEIKEHNPDGLEEISEKIKLVMGDDCTVEFEFVATIPHSDSGKYLYAVSEVDGFGQ